MGGRSAVGDAIGGAQPSRSAAAPSAGTVPDPLERALAAIAGIERPVVVDVGGGSGTSAVPLAVRGCQVVVVDSSIDALAILRRRATDARVGERVQGIQGDADRLAQAVGANTADLVLCHHLLEELDDPAAAVAATAEVLRSGGVLSVLAAGRFGAVLAQARVGRVREARAVLEDPDGRFANHDPLRRRFDLDGLQALFDRAGLKVESTTGVGLGTSDPELEASLGAHPVFRQLGTDLQVLGRRSGL